MCGHVANPGAGDVAGPDRRPVRLVGDVVDRETPRGELALASNGSLRRR